MQPTIKNKTGFFVCNILFLCYLCKEKHLIRENEMNKKSRIIGGVTVVVILMMWSYTASALELSDKIETYKQICLDTRTAIEELDGKGVRECQARYLSYGEQYDVAELDLRLIDEEKQELPLDGHIAFNEAFLDSLIKYDMDYSLIGYDEHSPWRAAPSLEGNDIYVSDKVIPANGEVGYAYTGVGNMELVVVAERREDIVLTIESNGEKVELESTGEKGLIEYQWQLSSPYGEVVVITIANRGDRDLSCTLISN